VSYTGAVRHPGTAVEFEWDDDNVPKLGLRDIRPQDVEHVLWNGPRWLRNKRAGTADWLMEGRDSGGRRLLVGVLWRDEEEGVLRAITARELRS